MKPATIIKSRVMTFMAGRALPELRRLRGRLRRRGAPVVHYFHQVDDPYSHLAVQKISALSDRYLVKFEHHLVSAPAKEFQGDDSRFPGWAVRDARTVASFYGCELPDAVDVIDPKQIIAAQSRLAASINSADFADRAIEIGDSLWRGEAITSSETITGEVAAGDELRASLGHYLSGTFYFEGEWYWGVDRLLHLEKRLCDLGFSRDDSSLCVPRPEPESVQTNEAQNITLEYFPSLRSPYTAISFERTIDLVNRTGVTLKLRPVMPMMMRGIPAPRPKQLYIISDTRREADYYGVEFANRIVDPIGDPVKRAFALLPFMQSRNKGIQYCSNYLRAAWVDGIDITTDKGLQQVIETSGESWHEASTHFDNPDWAPLLEENVTEMLDNGLWGVPSFRVTGGNGLEPFSCWGQDRLWRVETEIARRCNNKNDNE